MKAYDPFANMNLLQKLGLLAQNVATKGATLQPYLQQQQQARELQEVGNVLGGSGIPEFAFKEQTPEQIAQAKQQQLYSLGSPSALQAIQTLQQREITPYQQAQLDLQKSELGLRQKELARSGRKFDLEVKKLERELSGKATIDPKEYFDQAQKLRKEFTSLSKNFIDRQDAYNTIQASAAEPSAAGDLALIFNFMKMQDPGSTVREGEFATAQNAAGIPERIRASYNNVISGQRLAAPQRKDFLDRASKIYNSALTDHQRREENFSNLSESFGIAPQQVLGAVDTRINSGAINPSQLTNEQLLRALQQ